MNDRRSGVIGAGVREDERVRVRRASDADAISEEGLWETTKIISTSAAEERSAERLNDTIEAIGDINGMMKRGDSGEFESHEGSKTSMVRWKPGTGYGTPTA